VQAALPSFSRRARTFRSFRESYDLTFIGKWYRRSRGYCTLRERVSQEARWKGRRRRKRLRKELDESAEAAERKREGGREKESAEKDEQKEEEEKEEEASAEVETVALEEYARSWPTLREPFKIEIPRSARRVPPTNGILALEGIQVLFLLLLLPLSLSRSLYFRASAAVRVVVHGTVARVRRAIVPRRLLNSATRKSHSSMKRTRNRSCGPRGWPYVIHCVTASTLLRWRTVLRHLYLRDLILASFQLCLA